MSYVTVRPHRYIVKADVNGSRTVVACVRLGQVRVAVNIAKAVGINALATPALTQVRFAVRAHEYDAAGEGAEALLRQQARRGRPDEDTPEELAAEGRARMLATEAALFDSAADVSVREDFLGHQIRGEWLPLDLLRNTGQFMFFGVMDEAPDGDRVSRIRQTLRLGDHDLDLNHRTVVAVTANPDFNQVRQLLE